MAKINMFSYLNNRYYPFPGIWAVEKQSEKTMRGSVVCILSPIFSLAVFHIPSQLTEMPGTG